MRNHTHIHIRTAPRRAGAPPGAGAVAPRKQSPTALTRFGRMFGSIIEWLRAGYPDEAPRTGHSPLLALNGPMALSAKQTAQIAAELGEAAPDSDDIAVAITKVTNQLPTPTQTRAATHALHRHKPPQR